MEGETESTGDVRNCQRLRRQRRHRQLHCVASFGGPFYFLVPSPNAVCLSAAPTRYGTLVRLLANGCAALVRTASKMDDTLTLPTVSVSVSKKEAVKQMLNVKDERKRAEYDVQLLANRLAYLRAEERAASKRLQDTKKRTEAVRRAKEREANKDSTKAAHAHQLALKEKRQQKQVQAKEAETEMAIASMTLQFQGEQELMEVSAPF